MVKGASDLKLFSLVDTMRNHHPVAFFASAKLACLSIMHAGTSIPGSLISGYTLTSPYKNTYNLYNRSSQRISLGVIAIEKVQHFIAFLVSYKITWFQVSLIKSQSTGFNTSRALKTKVFCSYFKSMQGFVNQLTGS
jgi:hypothetical protein